MLVFFAVPVQNFYRRYHSHSAGQRTEGLFGALIVHSPEVAVELSSAHTIGHEPHDLAKARHSRILPDNLSTKLKREDHLVAPTNGLLRVGSVIYDKEIVLLLHDWYHRTNQETIAWFESVRSLAKEVSRVLQYKLFVVLTM
jgi:hypothetical protein